MRFLVDLYRVVLAACAALLLIGAAFALTMLVLGGFDLGRGATLPVLIGIAAAVVVALGLAATFVAIHDRLAQLTAQVERIAEALELSAPPRGDS